MGIEIQEMTINNYEQVYDLWRESEGIELSEIDSKESIARFLKRNPGFSFIARDGDQIVGAVLCGHDGRQGYIHQLAVRRTHRRQGLGRSLVGRCIYALMQDGIPKCQLFIQEGNKEGIAFWKKVGWTRRVELVTMSQGLESDN
ncbi:MAG: GNAT family N-acetyltransferase [Chloroflexota bacterium]